MNSIGEIISNARRIKGYSQEKLAELCNVNLRTIQRVENNENEPRGKTLNLICGVLDIDVEELIKKNSPSARKTFATKIINWIFLILLNLVLISIIGYLVLDSRANWNSRLGGFLLSVFIPYFIVSLTKNINGTERLMKFGFGFIIYIVFANIMTEFQGIVVLVLTPCLLIASSILFFGNTIIKLSQ